MDIYTGYKTKSKKMIKLNPLFEPLIAISEVNIIYHSAGKRGRVQLSKSKNKKNRKIVKQLARVVIHDCNEYAKIAIFGYQKTQLNIDEK